MKKDTPVIVVTRTRFTMETVKPQFMHQIGYGEGNGYVAVFEGHPWYGIGYDDIPADVHGGLSYARAAELFGQPAWMVGFDTGHLGDSTSVWPLIKVFEEAVRLHEQAEDILKKAQVLTGK